MFGDLIRLSTFAPKSGKMLLPVNSRGKRSMLGNFLLCINFGVLSFPQWHLAHYRGQGSNFDGGHPSLHQHSPHFPLYILDLELMWVEMNPARDTQFLPKDQVLIILSEGF
jgi:hypothetical protein